MINKLNLKLTFFYLLLLFSYTSFAQHEVPPTSEFKITGQVAKEKTVTIKDLQKYKQDNLGDVPVRNHRGEEKYMAKGLKGVLLKTILDSAGITVNKPKKYAQIFFVLTASDGYKNIYSWSELFNTGNGDHVYLLTEKDGKTAGEMPGEIIVISLSDINTGIRYFKGLAKIEVRKAE